MSPTSLYQRVALAETITWAGLLIAMALKFTGVTEAVMPFAGGIHGFVFLCFCVSTVLIWVNNRWGAGRGIVGLASSIVPFATIPFERSTERQGLLAGPWRFSAQAGMGYDKPTTLPDRALAFVVRKPAVAAACALVGIVAVFLLLLSLGSPADWGK